MIPRTLYHIWLSDRAESAVAQECMRSWPLLDFNVQHVTLENCDRSELFVQQALACGTIEGRVKANDFLRLKYLHDRGGVYLDNDVEILRPFDDLLSGRCFLGAEDDRLVNLAVIGAARGVWLLKECLDAMRSFRGDGPDSPVDVSLGVATKILRSRGWFDSRKAFRFAGVTVFPRDTFYPAHWTKPVTESARGGASYTVHHWAMSWNDLVSVVVPCFNYGKYLAECLESIQAQTYPKVETIVVDDGSSDNTREVAARFPWARYVHQANMGLSGARNTGIRMAKGQYIQPLDADDRLGPAAIARAVALLDGADIACPGQQEFGDGRGFYKRAGVPLDLDAFMVGNRIHCASMFRRKAWADVGGYDERMRDGYEDWDLWIRLLAAGYSRVRVLDEPLFFYRVHSDSMLRTMGPKVESVKAYMGAKYRSMGLAPCATLPAMKRTDFLALAHESPASPDGLPGFLAVLRSGSLETDQPAAFAAIVTALHGKFLDAADWTDGDGADALLKASQVLSTFDDDSAGWNLVHLAAWAVTGDRSQLAEVVRAVLNRDGSAAAVHLGTAAISLLAEAIDADPILAAELKACNFSLGSFKCGSYPAPGSITLPLAPSGKPIAVARSRPGRGPVVPSRSVTASPAPTGVSSSLGSASVKAPAFPAEPPPYATAVEKARSSLLSPSFAPHGASAAGVEADQHAGVVLMTTFGVTVSLSITEAIKLGDGLNRGVLQLVRPAEGFVWTDDAADPQAHSVLVELDSFRGKGLLEAGGGLLQAEVTQIPSRGPDPNAGKYTGRIYNRAGGFDEFATAADDMNAAKFAVAERVRQVLTP